jgi:antirestriction protein ArdC
MTKEELNQKIAQVFLDSLKEDGSEWVREWNYRLATNLVTGKTYRRYNQFIINAIARIYGKQGSRMATFVQAKNQGHPVKKGSKSVVCYVSMTKYYGKNEELQKRFKDNAIPLDLRDQAIREGKAERSDFGKVFHKPFNLFFEDDLDGIKIEKSQPPKDFEKSFQVLEKFMENTGVTYVEADLENQPCYVPSRHEIHMPRAQMFTSYETYLSTLAHEIAHSTLKGLGREQENLSYAVEELNAEIASVMICAELGLDPLKNIDNNKAYVHEWIKNIEEKPETLQQAILTASSITNYVIEKGEATRIIAKKTEKDEKETQPVQTRTLAEKRQIFQPHYSYLQSMNNVFLRAPLNDFLQGKAADFPITGNEVDLQSGWYEDRNGQELCVNVTYDLENEKVQGRVGAKKYEQSLPLETLIAQIDGIHDPREMDFADLFYEQWSSDTQKETPLNLLEQKMKAFQPYYDYLSNLPLKNYGMDLSLQDYLDGKGPSEPITNGTVTLHVGSIQDKAGSEKPAVINYDIDLEKLHAYFGENIHVVKDCSLQQMQQEIAAMHGPEDVRFIEDMDHYRSMEQKLDENRKTEIEEPDR